MALASAIDGAAFSGAKLVIVTAETTAASGHDSPMEPIPNLPDTATVLEMPPYDDGSFARLLGAFAASLDAGTDPARAFRDGVVAAGWEPSVE
jgi:hypothetical protein